MKILALSLCLFLYLTDTTDAAATVASPAWIEESNRIAGEFAAADGELFPERASATGYREFDGKALRMEKNHNERTAAFLLEWKSRLTRELSTAKDKNLRIDLEILRDHLDRKLAEVRLEERHGVVTFIPGTRFVLESLLTLLNDQADPSRRTNALLRFRTYANGTEDSAPLLDAFRNRTMADELRFQKKQLAPLAAEVEQYLAESGEYLKGIEGLLKKAGLAGWEADFAKLSAQSAAYDDFLRTHVLPKARKTYRLPKEIYAHTLRLRGVEDSPDTLIKTARKAYKETFRDFRALAKEVAKLEKLKVSEPAAVIAHLKKKQVTKPEEVKALFENANSTLEAIIRREQLVTLPFAPLRIRVASEAESLANPVPHLDPPPLVGNSGQRPEFVVPSFTSGNSVIDDFSYEAAALVLSAHEGRPGHDLQFSTMLDQGTSIIRARYAFNNANVEGWGLYAEELVYPYLPPQAQLVALQMRLVRIARAFFDPEIQLGKIAPREVTRLLTGELGLSERLAGLELRRFQFENPGQAPSYFYGLTRMASAKKRVSLSLGRRFSQKCFHDGVLSLGMLPVGMIGREVERGWDCAPNKAQARVPSESGAGAN
jgi:uncharacterized protein (DUF885 family)